VLILLSNDDGYFAPGLSALERALSSFGSVTVVAPERDRSGASNSLTLDRPLSVKTAVNGYYYVNLYKDKKQTHKYIHRLLAETFIENPNNKLYVDHKDNNHDNDSSGNLRAMSKSANVAKENKHRTGTKAKAAAKKAVGSTKVVSGAAAKKAAAKTKTGIGNTAAESDVTPVG
jgi:hypothetical protein